MKKIITILTGILICLGINAQVNSKLNNPTLKSINDKVFISKEANLAL